MAELTPLLQRIKQSVYDSEQNANVLLFGSYARGTQGALSDIDLLILVDKDAVTPKEEDKITFPLYSIGFEEGIIISPFVYTKNAWINHVVTPFYENVNKDARVL